MSDYIPEDNLALILRWLPVKTLLRFRCVCKGWKEIIDSPLFVKEQLSLQKPRFLVQNEGSPECFVLDHALPSVDMLNGLIEDHDYLFLGTHNGVVCLFDCSSRSNLLLWNPSIRKFLTVPIPDYWDCGWEYVGGESCFGFWIDPCTKEFKFVTFDSILDEEGNPVGVKAAVYSSILQDWRVIPPPEVDNWAACPPVMIQGAAHWRANKSEDNTRIIVSFDFVLERFDLIEMPPHLKSNFTEPIHCRWQGNLSLVVRDPTHSDRYDVYLRQEGLWVNMFGFSLLLLPRMHNVLWVVGEEERVRVLARNHGDLVLYDTRDGIIRLTDEDSDEDYFVEDRLTDEDSDEDYFVEDRLTDEDYFVENRVRICVSEYDEVCMAYDFVESLIFP